MVPGIAVPASCIYFYISGACRRPPPEERAANSSDEKIPLNNVGTHTVGKSSFSSFEGDSESETMIDSRPPMKQRASAAEASRRPIPRVIIGDEHATVS